jgi:pyruvate,water dikinase
MWNLFGNVFAFWRPKPRQLPFAVLFKKFQHILERNNRILELMADMGDKLGGEYVFDRRYIEQTTEQMGDHVFKLISDLSVLTQRKNVDLFMAFERIRNLLWQELAGRPQVEGDVYVLDLRDVGHDQIEQVGGKMAHIGDIRGRLGLSAPDGFVITSRAFFDFMNSAGLLERARKGIAAWDGEDAAALDELAADMRSRILDAPLPRGLAREVGSAAARLVAGKDGLDALLAVRSSAWHEDGESSFAGQYASVLDVVPDRVMDAYREVVASAYSATAWRYRIMRGYREHEVSMAVGCQLMVRGRVSGVLHSYAPAADEVMAVDAARGGCRTVVDGSGPAVSMLVGRTEPHAVRIVSPQEAGAGDEPPLTAVRARELAEAALAIERYYKRPQDIEWTFDERCTSCRPDPCAGPRRTSGLSPRPSRPPGTPRRSSRAAAWWRSAAWRRALCAWSVPTPIWRVFPPVPFSWPGTPRRAIPASCARRAASSPTSVRPPGTWPPSPASSACRPWSTRAWPPRCCARARRSPSTRPATRSSEDASAPRTASS